MMIELLIGIVVLLLIFILTGLFIVKQQEVALIERLGKYHSIAHAGLNFKIPFIDWIAGKLSLRIQQLDVKVETKTKDNVIVQIQVSVQYRIKDGGVYDAYYKLEDPTQQITAYVLDLVRSETPTMILDDIFEKKDSIANAVKSHLTDTMKDFGFEIVKAFEHRVRSQSKKCNE